MTEVFDTAKLRSQDPREFIPHEKFKKLAAQLDPNPSHPWNSITSDLGTFYNTTDSTLIMAGLTKRYEGTIRTGSVLALWQDNFKQTTNSGYLADLDSYNAEIIFEVFYYACQYLSPVNRLVITGAMMADDLPFRIATPDTTAASLYEGILGMLPPPAKGINIHIENIPRHPDNPLPKGHQRFQFDKLVNLAANTIEPQSLDKLLKELESQLRFVDEAFGKNYPGMLLQLTKTVLENRDDTYRQKLQYIHRPPLHTRFPTENLVRVDIQTIEDLTRILTNIPARVLKTYFTESHPKAEFVNLEEVIGGYHYNINDFPGTFFSNIRGKEYLFKMVRGLQSGSFDINRGELLEVQYVDGEYYVLHGHHRISALKALGIPFVPLLVRR